MIFFAYFYNILLKNGVSLFAKFLPAGTSKLIAPLSGVIGLISTVAKFISSGVRLFANIFAGHLLLKALYSASFQVILYLFVFVFICWLKIGGAGGPRSARTAVQRYYRIRAKYTLIQNRPPYLIRWTTQGSKKKTRVSTCSWWPRVRRLQHIHRYKIYKQLWFYREQRLRISNSIRTDELLLEHDNYYENVDWRASQQMYVIGSFEKTKWDPSTVVHSPDDPIDDDVLSEWAAYEEVPMNYKTNGVRLTKNELSGKVWSLMAYVSVRANLMGNFDFFFELRSANSLEEMRAALGGVLLINSSTKQAFEAFPGFRRANSLRVYMKALFRLSRLVVFTQHHRLVRNDLYRITGIDLINMAYGIRLYWNSSSKERLLWEIIAQAWIEENQIVLHRFLLNAPGLLMDKLNRAVTIDETFWDLRELFAAERLLCLYSLLLSYESVLNKAIEIVSGSGNSCSEFDSEQKNIAHKWALVIAKILWDIQKDMQCADNVFIRHKREYKSRFNVRADSREGFTEDKAVDYNIDHNKDVNIENANFLKDLELKGHGLTAFTLSAFRDLITDKTGHRYCTDEVWKFNVDEIIEITYTVFKDPEATFKDRANWGFFVGCWIKQVLDEGKLI